MPTFIASPNVSPESLNEISIILFDDIGDSIGPGSKNFFDQIFQDLKISADPKSWNVEPCRCDYYSDFPDEEEWEDVWRVTWKARVITKGNIGMIPLMKSIFIESIAEDENWIYEKRVTSESITNCLIISDFNSFQDLKNVVDKIAKLAFQSDKDYIKKEIKLKIVRIMDTYHQLQIDLGKVKPSFYANGAKDARAVQKICIQEKGTTHFLQRSEQ
ncbi:MAG: hypothetical protein H7334_00680 [Ferruginibacter sp.]|nr:hypothetical protein [Ferruginibacter sp.]